MAKIIIYNNDTDRMEVYYRGEEAPMPYNTNGTLKVREFRLWRPNSSRICI